MRPSIKSLVAENDRLLHTFRLLKDNRRLIAALAFDGQYPSRVDLVRPGQFTWQRRTDATTSYLRLAGVPQTSAQIAAALARGNVRSSASDDYASQYQTMYAGKKLGRFRRWGLRHWVNDQPPAVARTPRRLAKKGTKS